MDTGNMTNIAVERFGFYENLGYLDKTRVGEQLRQYALAVSQGDSTRQKSLEYFSGLYGIDLAVNDSTWEGDDYPVIKMVLEYIANSFRSPVATGDKVVAYFPDRASSYGALVTIMEAESEADKYTFAGDYSLPRKNFRKVEDIGEVWVELGNRVKILDRSKESLDSALALAGRNSKQHQDDIDKISDKLIELAEEHSWCSSFDEAVTEINKDLNRPLRTREQDYEVEVEVEFSATATVQVTVSASSEEDAEDRAGEYDDLDQLVEDQLTNGNAAFDRVDNVNSTDVVLS